MLKKERKKEKKKKRKKEKEKNLAWNRRGGWYVSR